MGKKEKVHNLLDLSWVEMGLLIKSLTVLWEERWEFKIPKNSEGEDVQNP